MTGYPVDYASIIVNYMYRVANLRRPSSLPYGNLLTRIFHHFKVPLTSEEYAPYVIPVISSHSLKSICFFKTASRGWKHIFKLTPEEACILKVQTSDSSSLQAIAATLDSLKEEQAELRTQMDLLHSDMGLLSRKIDELIRLTRLVHYLAKLAIPFKPSDVDHASTVADHLIRTTSFDPHFI